jgi:hypothetical protein
MVLLTLSYSVSSPVAVLSGLVEWGHVGGLVGCLGWFQTKDRGGEGGGALLLSDFLGRKGQFGVLCSVDGVTELSYAWFLSLLLRTVQVRPVRIGSISPPPSRRKLLGCNFHWLWLADESYAKLFS